MHTKISSHDFNIINQTPLIIYPGAASDTCLIPVLRQPKVSKPLSDALNEITTTPFVVLFVNLISP
jgi:hypothetical protein